MVKIGFLSLIKHISAIHINNIKTIFLVFNSTKNKLISAPKDIKQVYKLSKSFSLISR